MDNNDQSKRFCGAKVTKGHGDCAVCGQEYYRGIYQCDSCTIKELREKLARSAQPAPVVPGTKTVSVAALKWWLQNHADDPSTLVERLLTVLDDCIAAAPAQPAAQGLCNCPAGSKPEPHKHAPNCPYRTGAAAQDQGEVQRLREALMSCAKAKSAAEVGLIVDGALAASTRQEVKHDA